MIPFGRRHIRNFRRVREIIRVFRKYGFLYLFRRSQFPEQLTLPLFQKETTKRTPQENLRLAFEELGTTFIKLGQILSTRPDLLPEEYCQELRKLQDQTSPVSFLEIREVVEQELKKPIEEIFAEFDPAPLASASIAQVHRAVLKDGNKAAVKVQKPGVEEKVISDLEILFYLANLADRLTSFAPLTFSEMVTEFQKSLMREIDFLYEAVNARRFRENFSDFEGVYIPRVFDEYTTTRVLTLELIEGFNLSQMAEKGQLQIDGPFLARRGAEAVLKMIFEDGFFHADPHPGNIMVREETGELVFLDFGIVGTVDERTRENMERMLLAVLRKDTKRVVDILEDEFLLSPVESPLTLRVDLHEILERYVTANLKEMNISSLVNDFFYLLRKHSLRFPPHLSSLMRALMVVEGTGMMLDPHFTVVPYLEKALERTFAQRLRWERLSEKVTDYLFDWQKLLANFPDKAQELSEEVSRGRIRFQMESEDLKNLNRRLDRVSNRLSLSVILGSLLIGSSLIYISSPRPGAMGILGILGFGIAALLGIFLVIEMLRSR
ncbi:MAG TPA: AarF/ABC1/UbiB kinase family protein [Candidatus Atribacteria bacterium]|nr:AarF/ABC1/UbiB kinase family protein [Candidatus Atribacteria bacterium]